MPAKSKKQQRFMGMVYASQKGELKDAPPAVTRAAKSMSKEDAKDFASTKHEGLPSKVKKARHTEFAEKLAAAKDLVDMDSVGGMLADYLAPQRWGGERAGRSQAMADAAGADTTFGVRHPMTQTQGYTTLGSLLGIVPGLAHAILTKGRDLDTSALTMAGGGIAGMAGGLGLAGYNRRKAMKMINKKYDRAEEEGKLNPKTPDLSMLSALALPLRGPHRTGQVDAVNAMRTGKSIGELRGANHGRDMLYAAQQIPYAGPVLGLLQGWGQNARTQGAADDMKIKEAHITFAEKLAGTCNKPKMAPSYSKKAKIGKKPMPQPHERQRKKVANTSILGAGTTLGGALGALSAPSGHMAEGYGRGAARGLNSTFGAVLGAIPGALLGKLYDSYRGGNGMHTVDRTLTGMGLGAAGGGLLGGVLTDVGKPSWESGGKIQQEDRDAQVGSGAIGAGLLGGGLGAFGGRALGADKWTQLAAALGVGVPTGLATGYLLDRNIPQPTKEPPQMSPETKDEMTAEQMAAP